MRQLILKQNFSYNALGQRVGVSYTYTPPTSSSGSAVAIGTLLSYSKSYDCDQSGRLIAENKTNEYYGEPGDSEKIVFLYDEAGMVGFVYTKSGTSNTYYYDRNIRGDVIGIYDENGVRIVKYSYDAWGNCTIDSSTTNTTLARANPIRYRGYYYDVDTGLYYLNSRYYTPEWRRFISPDDTSYLDPETPNGLNLYCYCNNDPVNYADPSGHSVIASAVIIGAIIGGLTSFAFSLTTELIHEKGDLSAEDWWQVAASTIIGAAEGALLIIAPGASMLICSLSSAIDTAIYEAIDGSSIQKILINSAISAFFGAAAGANSRDFIKSKELLLQVLDAKRIMNSNVRPLIIKEAKKHIPKQKSAY